MNKLKIFKDGSNETFGFEIINEKNEIELSSDGFLSEELAKQEVRNFKDIFNNIDNLD